MVVKSQIKLIKSLQQKKYRTQHSLFVVEGIKTILELLKSDIDAQNIYTTDASFLKGNEGSVTIISETELKQMSSLKNPNKVLGIFKIPNAREVNKKGLILMGGIQFQQLNELVTKNTMEERVQLEMVTVSETENAQGQIINTQQEQQLVTTITTTRQLLVNQYRSINVPFGIGFNLKQKKSNLKLMTGLDLNIYQRFNGDFVVTRDNYINIEGNSANAERIFKKTTGLNAWATIAYNKTINERLSWVVAPSIQMPLSSMTTPENTHLKLWRFRVQLGFNYILNNYPKKRADRRKRSRHNR